MVVVPPLGNLVVQQLLQRAGDPGGGVDAVGDGVDVVVGEHLLRDLAVLHGDAVDVAREAQRQVGHVEQAVVQAAEALDGVAALVAEDGVHLVEAELVVPGGHRRVGGEDASLAIAVDIFLGGSAQGRAGEALLQQADAEQRGVALVHVVDLGLDAERLQQGDAAEAEHGLLAEPVVGVAAVEVVGQPAVLGVVAFEVGVAGRSGMMWPSVPTTSLRQARTMTGRP